MRNFRTLTIWQDAMTITKDVYKYSNLLPTDEKFGLTSQIRRAAVSVPSNIAEGCGRRTNKDFSRFLEIAISSSFEVETQLILASEIYSLPSDSLIKKINILQKQIGSLMRKLG